MKFLYSLPENKNNLLELEISDEKYFTLIYGHNGVGKSSFANSIHKNSVNDKYNNENDKTLEKWKTYLFNREYIYENVYITNENGFTSKSKHSQFWGDIFLGNKINAKNIEIEKINKCKTSLKFNFNNINYKDLTNYLNNGITEKELIKAYSTYISDFSEKDFIKYYSCKNINTNFLYNESDFQKLNLECKYKFNFQHKEIQEEIIKLIDKPQLLSANNLIKIYNEEIVIKFNNLKTIIGEYNENLKDLEVLKKSIVILQKQLGNNLELSDNLKNWIRKGIELHKDKTCCLFCSNSDLRLVEHYKIILNNKIEISRKKILDKIKEINQIIENQIIMLEKHINRKYLISEVLENIDVIKNLFSLFEENLKSEKEITEFSLILKNINIIDVENNNIKILLEFLLMKNSMYQLEIKKILYKKELEKKYKEINIEIDSIINNTIDEVQKIINDYKVFLGIDSEVCVEVQNPPGGTSSKKKQLVFKKNKKNITNAVSDGQRFKFALLIFINEIKNTIKYEKNVINNLIIFDDPIDSADMFTYFSFKSILIDFARKMDNIGKNIKVIILTHNIDYAMIQFNTEEKFLEKMEFIKMQINKSVPVPYKEMFISDKLMFLQLHEKLIETSFKDPNNGKYIFDKEILLFYISLVRKYLETFLEEIYVFNSKENLDVSQFKNHQEQLKWIKKNINETDIIEKCELIIDVLMNILNKKWLEDKIISKEEIDKIFEAVLFIKERNLIKTTEDEKNIFSNYLVPKNIKISDLKNIEKVGTTEKYFLASKLLAKKNINDGSIFEFIKTFLRHPNSNFIKPFIAFDEKILDDIITKK